MIRNGGKNCFEAFLTLSIFSFANLSLIILLLKALFEMMIQMKLMPRVDIF